MEDRRLRARFKVTLPVTMATAQGTIEGKTKDLSAVGAFICCQEPLMPKERCLLNIHLDDGSVHEVVAEVVWSKIIGNEEKLEPAGMGVRFIH